MKTICKIAGTALVLFMMFILDIPILSEQLVPEAQAIFGVRRRAFVVGASVGAASAATAASVSVAASSQAAAASQQQAAAAQQQAAASQQEAAFEKQQAVAAQQHAAMAQQQAAASGKPLPLGTVVSALPPGCVSTPSGGVEYYYCGGNFYRTMFQGNTLVYVTAKP
jgi:hypothetical protein